MKVLTVHQPWAWAIAWGDKRIENRTWEPWGIRVGEWFAIHAAAAPRTKADREELRELCVELDAPVDLEHKAVIAVAKFGGILREQPPIESRHSMWWAGPLAWILDEVFTLRCPIPMSGAQGLWQLPANAIENIRDQWRKQA